MSDKERKNSLAGVFIGGRGEELNKFLLELKQRGVNISPTTLSRIRGGFISGDLTTQQLLFDEAKTAKDSSLKVGLYLDISNLGLKNRSYQPSHSQRYQSEGFTQGLAEQLELSGGNIRSCLRAMRADLVLYCAQSPQTESIPLFVQSAEDYLLAYSTPPSTRGADQKANIYTNWNRNSVLDFYRRLYLIAGPRGVGTWAPYEIEVFSHFYQLQLAGRWLAPLDELTFERYVTNRQNTDLVTLVKEQTGTDFNDDALIAHANALAFGKPFNPLISKNKKHS